MKISWQMLLLGILSIGLGYYLNTLANKRSNEKLIAAIKEELALMNQTKGRITNPLERTQIELQEAQLIGKLSCLENQL